MTRAELILQYGLGAWAAASGFEPDPMPAPADAARAYNGGYHDALAADRAGTFGPARQRPVLCGCPAVECVRLREQAHAEIRGGLPLSSDQVAAMDTFRVPGGAFIQEKTS